MVGILIALPGTQLERRLEREGRLLYNSGGDNFMRTNFVTALDEVALLEGYARLLAEIYSADGFYARALRSLALCPVDPSPFRFAPKMALGCLVRSLWRQGVRGKHRSAYWRFLARAFVQTPRRISRAFGMAINAEHMVRYTEEEVLPRLQNSLSEARREPRKLARVPRRLPLADGAGANVS
jgi:hypothetical protein